MKILQEKDGLLTGSEVYNIVLKNLKELDQVDVQVDADNIRCRYAYVNALHYLEDNTLLCEEDLLEKDAFCRESFSLLGLQISCVQTVARKTLINLLDELYRVYQLKETELLQIACLAPTRLVDLYVLITDCAERFQESTLEAMLRSCQHAFL